MHTPLPQRVIFDRDEVSGKSRHVGYAPKATNNHLDAACRGGPILVKKAAVATHDIH